MKTILLFIITGFSAGFINGLFGTGGALPILALFSYYSMTAERSLATANLTVMLFSLVSFFFYLKNGTLPQDFFSDYLKGGFLPALLGGALGSLLLSRFSTGFLKKLFCLITMVGGVGMMFR